MTGINYYLMTKPTFIKFTKGLFGDSFYQSMLSYWGVQAYPQLKAAIDPIQYVSSLLWFPFSNWNRLGLVGDPNNSDNAGDGLTPEQRDCTYVDVSHTTIDVSPVDNTYRCKRIATDSVYWWSNLFTAQFQPHPLAVYKGNYLNVDPYTKVRLFCQPFGVLDLDPKVFSNTGYIRMSIEVDERNGDGVLKIGYGNSSQTVTDQVFVSAKIGVEVPLTQFYVQGDVNYGTMMNAATGPVGKMGISEYNNGSPFNQSINIDGAQLTKAAYNAIGNGVEANIPQVKQFGTRGSRVIYENTIIHLEYEYADIVPEDNTQKGRPFCKYVQINTLSGYILCSDSEVAINGTAQEQRRIVNYLESGFFYE